MQGGASSGFNHVPDAYDKFRPRLFHCKGKRNVRCAQVNCIKESLNLGDVFILDKGMEIYVWMPPESGRLERIKGMSQAKGIRDLERGGRPKIIVLDQDWNKNDTFWKTFGGKEVIPFIKSPIGGGKDDEYWRESRDTISLSKYTLLILIFLYKLKSCGYLVLTFRISDASGELKVTKVSQGGLNIKDLDTNVFSIKLKVCHYLQGF